MYAKVIIISIVIAISNIVLITPFTTKINSNRIR